MCTNFTSTADSSWVRRHFAQNLPRAENLEVYPGQRAPIAYLGAQGQVQIELAQFGLLPSWVDEVRAKTFHRHTYNARIESVQTKPSFRQAWRQAQYAVLLLDDFFEPCYESGVAVRHRIQTTLNEPFGVACLWDRWSRPQEHRRHEIGGKPGLLSFTMLTLNADQHPVMSRMHPPEDEKRMPWVLVADQFEAWLNAVPTHAQDLARRDVMPTLKTQAHPRPTPIKTPAQNAKAEKTSSAPDQLDLF